MRRLILSTAITLTAMALQTHAFAAEEAKNWKPPAGKLYMQTLSEEIMHAHPDLISVTFHGVPPGAAPKTYTMFGGSYLDRIGNPDDPDDIMVIEKGITILDPRWHKQDPVSKYVVQTPLRDAKGQNIGLVVLAYHHTGESDTKTEKEFFQKATTLRDELQKKIPSFEALFKASP
jgi:hypothetical protein